MLPTPSILADVPLQLDLNIEMPANDEFRNALQKAELGIEGFLMHSRPTTFKETATMFRRALLPPYDECEM